jgi:hypothetical protein
MAETAHAHGHEEKGSVDTLIGLKKALIFMLFFVCYLGLIPAYSKYCLSSQVTLSLMSCFAGGVFLAMAFIQSCPRQSNNTMVR